jgi:ubiquinone/menaquinone biosynthesis C-methylase UbiE
MPFRDASYDVVYSFGVLHHTPRTSLAIEEVCRVLKPGGTAIISVYNQLSLNMFAWLLSELLQGNLFREPLRKTMARIEAGNTGYAPLVKVYSRTELRRMLRGFSSVRFTTRHVSGLDFIPGPLRRMLEPYFGWYLIATCQK